MTHKARQESYPTSEGNPVSLVAPEVSTFTEERRFLGVLAADAILSINATTNQDSQTIVAKNFIHNVERLNPGVTGVDHDELARRLIVTAENEMITHLQEQNRALMMKQQEIRDNQMHIKEILMRTSSADVLLALAPYLAVPLAVEDDTLSTTDQIATPTTAELEEQMKHLTVETRSPARGIALTTLARRAVGQLVGAYGSVVHSQK